MNLLIGIALSLAVIPSAFASTTIYEAEAREELSVITMPELVDYYAEKHGVENELAHYIIKGESTYNPEAKGDLNIICNNPRSPHNGQPVYARGLGQLTRCYYPEVSDEEAFNAKTNLDITMGIIAKGKEVCEQQFTTCREYYEIERSQR